MRVLKGKSTKDPIVIRRSDLDKNKMSVSMEAYSLTDVPNMPKPIYPTMDGFIAYLDILFGGNDGSYFIKHESMLDKENETYKVFSIEDGDGEHHTIFFLIKD